jgi:hypothetical protein
MNYNDRNSKVLASFTAYCKAHPQERFWQALRNWSGAYFILWNRDGRNDHDTFNWEGRDHDEV